MNEFRERLAVWSGMIGSLLFLAVFVAEDVFRRTSIGSALL